ncbi:MAG: hypothetical protein ABEK59_04595 [Halobacteria archaeon]
MSSEEGQDDFRLDIFVDKNYAIFAIMGVFGALSIYLANIIKLGGDTVLKAELVSVMGLIASFAVFLLLNFQIVENVMRDAHLTRLSLKEEIKIWILLYALIAIGVSVIIRLLEFRTSGTDLVILAGIITGSTFSFYVNRWINDYFDRGLWLKIVSAVGVILVSVLAASSPSLENFVLGYQFDSIWGLLEHATAHQHSVTAYSHKALPDGHDFNIYLYFILIGAPLGSILYLINIPVEREQVKRLEETQ